MKYIILFFVFSFTVAVSANDFIKEINALKTKSFETAPELKIARALKSEKNASNFSSIALHTPHASLDFKQQHDFIDTNPLLKTMGIVPPDHSWAINYNWSLFNYGLLQTTLKNHEESKKAELELSNKEKEYEVNFSANLLNFLLAKYKTSAVLNSLKKSDTAKKEATLGFELGQKTKIDVLRADANFVSLSSKKTKFLQEEQETKSTFLELTGLETESINFLALLSEEEILNLINQLTQTPSLVALRDIQNSPMLKIIDSGEKINTHALNLITKDEWPELRIQGSYSNAGTDFSQSFSNPMRSHSVAIVLSFPILGGGSLVSTNFAQYFAKKQLEYSLQKERLQLKNSFENTFQKIKTAETLVASLSLNVSQFEELFRLTSKSYQLGKSTLFELLDVQDNLLDSKINLAQNKIQLFTLTQNYIWQTGTL